MAQASENGAAEESQPQPAPSSARGDPREHLTLGNALLDEGKIDRAISAFRRALRLDDTLAEAHNDLGTAYYHKGWHAEAESCFRKAIERKPDHGVAYANLGAALRAQGRLGDSRRAYQRALWLKLAGLLPRSLRRAPAPAPQPAPSLVAELQPIRLAIEQGRAAQALELAEALRRRHPADADALHACAVAREAGRDYDSALALVRQALARRDDRSEYHVSLSRLLLRAGDFNRALAAGLHALKLEPGSAAIHATISGVFHMWRDDLAEQAARHALELEPGLPVAHANLAAALWGQGRLEEAASAARKAVALDPRSVAFRTNLALILKDLGRVDETRALYRELIDEAPAHGKVCLDVGTLAFESEADLDTARAMYRKAQANADEPRARLAEGLLDLMQGEWAAGWDRYEARKLLNDQRAHHDQFAALPDWDGAPLAEGKLLVYGEQGLGDEIMFASMLGELAGRAKNMVLTCDPRLASLFARSFPGIEVIGERPSLQGTRAAADAAIRCKVAAGSLGRLFRRRAADFAGHRGYLIADPGRAQAWRARLAGGGDGLKVGLSWIGGTQKTGRSRRSLPLQALQPMLSLGGVRWVSLQYTDAAGEIAAFQQSTGIVLEDASAATRDMDELAALVSTLDLVVSVCNATVHLAGALGREVLVMAPFVPEWRYGMRGEAMTWYPSARVFRQSAYGDWTGVVAAVTRVLRARGS